MIKFPEQQDLIESVYLDITDKPLPEKLVQSTRYIHFKTIAQGGKALIQSCKDLHLGRIICYKQLKPEFAGDLVEQRRFPSGSENQRDSSTPKYSANLRARSR